MADTKKPFPDPLVRQRLFPNPSEIFAFLPRTLLDALKDGIIAVDTNVLLIPYTTGRASLEQIRNTYARIASENRLRIPGQVVREFADNRAEKLKDLFQQLSRKRNIDLSISEYPLLEGIPTYAEMVKREGEIGNALNEYRKIVGSLLDTVAGWHWDDPVSQIYRDIFKAQTVIDPEFGRDELLKELAYRQEHEIPPGYKDRGNEYSGIGDLLIWKTLLKIGEQESRDLIFVSGDEKSDWRYRSENRALYPRFELVDEYRRASKGRTLLIISFAELLQQFGVPEPIVEKVKQEEAAASVAKLPEKGTNIARSAFFAERAVRRWLSEQYPNGEIERGGPGFADFIVQGPDSRQGYEVKYFSYRAFMPVRYRLINALQQIQRCSIEMRVTLVVAIGDVSETELPIERVDEILTISRELGIKAIVVGIIVNGKFEVKGQITRP